MIRLTWLGHASWLIEDGTHKILLDPFLTENPAATATVDDFTDATHVLLSHGHFDHVADAAAVLEASGAQLVTNYEIAEWFGKHHGVTNAIGMNIGGNVSIGEGSAKMTPALHSSSLPDGSYAGAAAGFVISLGGCRVYFACDTAYFSDMKWYAHGVDVAVLPIGDLFTMGVDDSLEAIKLIEPKIVLPMHYGTWPPIEQDASAWVQKVESETGSKAKAPAVGEPFEL
ncbi:MAG: metal-dependent hydrolase [Planctomycetota bacterium]